ncbi:MAG: sulfatase [Planctomycetota bacterium]|jgi:arylsulfatase A-like enzyme
MRLLAGALLAFALPLSAQGSPREVPSIILIVADDLGYADVGFHGQTQIPTPHIDSIAKSGVTFTNGYVSCPVCSPTRAGLLTGRYQNRFGHEFNTGGIRKQDSEIGLPTTEITLAQALKKLGYRTGAVGKWHLGEAPKFHPLERGFDEFFGFLGGGRSYFNDKRAARTPIYRGRKKVEETEYLTDAFGREAAAFVERNALKPFFLYLAFNAVHTPMHATPHYLGRFEKIEDKRRRTYAAMLSAMDDAIGRVMEAVRKPKLEENCLIVFISDNGGPTRANGSSNAPLRGVKGQMYEGGIRVPFAIQWLPGFPKGAKFEDPVIALDLFPTLVGASHGRLPEGPPLDGVDLIPYVRGKKKGRPHDTLCWRQGEKQAIRHGDWKLVRQTKQVPELFNLKTDIGEANDFALTNPKKLKELQQLYADWDSQMVEPRWSTPVRNRRRARQREPDDGEAAFRLWDKDGDGKLTAEELGRKALHRRMDQNGDGVVTLEEAKAHYGK